MDTGAAMQDSLDKVTNSPIKVDFMSGEHSSATVTCSSLSTYNFSGTSILVKPRSVDINMEKKSQTSQHEAEAKFIKDILTQFFFFF